jgi:hypothetical protein
MRPVGDCPAQVTPALPHGDGECVEGNLCSPSRCGVPKSVILRRVVAVSRDTGCQWTSCSRLEATTYKLPGIRPVRASRGSVSPERLLKIFDQVVRMLQSYR